jgi:hypothetical protein
MAPAKLNLVSFSRAEKTRKTKKSSKTEKPKKRSGKTRKDKKMVVFGVSKYFFVSPYFRR